MQSVAMPGLGCRLLRLCALSINEEDAHACDHVADCGVDGMASCVLWRLQLY
jgi:hypothetical protein